MGRLQSSMSTWRRDRAASSTVLPQGRAWHRDLEGCALLGRPRPTARSEAGRVPVPGGPGPCPISQPLFAGRPADCAAPGSRLRRHEGEREISRGCPDSLLSTLWTVMWDIGLPRIGPLPRPRLGGEGCPATRDPVRPSLPGGRARLPGPTKGGIPRDMALRPRYIWSARHGSSARPRPENGDWVCPKSARSG